MGDHNAVYLSVDGVWWHIRQLLDAFSFLLNLIPCLRVNRVISYGAFSWVLCAFACFQGSFSSAIGTAYGRNHQIGVLLLRSFVRFFYLKALVRGTSNWVGGLSSAALIVRGASIRIFEFFHLFFLLPGRAILRDWPSRVTDFVTATCGSRRSVVFQSSGSSR